MAAEAYKCGPYVRLWGIHPSQLPPDPEATSPEDLIPLLTAILSEAVPFVDSVPSDKAASSSGPWKATGCKTFPHSAAPVELYERIVSAEHLQTVSKEHKLPQVPPASKIRPETWFLRRSLHEDAAKAGTASWEEWTRCFKQDHGFAEFKFTPTVKFYTTWKQWDCAGIEIPLGDVTFENLTLRREESVHKMPPPLRNRVFPVLQVTAGVRGRKDFIVVQIAAVPEVESADSRPQGTWRGAYTSVERFRQVGEQHVEWVMGTVSDARGVLPAWVQKMAVPGAIAKDVDMFLEWMADERIKGGTWESIFMMPAAS